MSEHMHKMASADHPILDVISQRWSPYVFQPRGVEREKILSCLEAARWAASSFNEQPWSFLVALREDEDEFGRMLDCLMEANQLWAGQAGALLLTVISRRFARNGKPNRVAEHDMGLAIGNFTAQATSLGLAVHQMAGVDLERARQAYAIAETHSPLTALAVGYAGSPDEAVQPSLAERDRSARSRKPLAQFVFAQQWNQPARWL